MSAHFAVLREAGLVEAEKNGRVITYRLKMSVLEDALLGFVHAVGLNISKDSASEQAKDKKRGKR